MACAALQNGVAPDLEEQQAAQREAEAKLQQQKEKEKQEKLSQKTRDKEQQRVRKHPRASIRHLITIHVGSAGVAKAIPCPYVLLAFEEVEKCLQIPPQKSDTRCNEG